MTMKKEILKFNYIIMAIILVVLTILVFSIASIMSGNVKDHDYDQYEVISKNKSEKGYSEKNFIYNDSISQSDYLKEIDEGETDIEMIHVDPERNYHYTSSVDDIVDDPDPVVDDPDPVVDDPDPVVDDPDPVVDDPDPVVDDTDNLLYLEGRDYCDDSYYEDSIKTLRKLIRLYPESVYTEPAEIVIGKAILGRGKKNNFRDDFIKANNMLENILKEFLEDKSKKNNNEYLTQLMDFIISLSDANIRWNIPNEDIENYLDNIVDMKIPTAVKDAVYTSLGFLKLFREAYTEAQNDFLRADTDLALIGLSRTYLELEAFEDAYDIWMDFLDNRKTSFYYPEALSLFKYHTLNHSKELFDVRNYNKCIEYTEDIIKYIDNQIEEEEAVYLNAVCYFNKQEYEKALNRFDELMKNDDYSRDSYAKFYMGKTRIEIARSKNDIIDKIKLYEISLSNLIDFTDIYSEHPFRNEALALIDYLKDRIIGLQQR